MVDITCPNCEHSIDDHDGGCGCVHWAGTRDVCSCMRLPSDIVTERILTPLAELADHLEQQRPKSVAAQLSRAEGYGYAVTRIRALLEEVRDA